MNARVALLCLTVAACTPRETPTTAPTASQETALVTAFAAGSLIIPMDTTSQNNGTLRAFGLVDRLLRANVPVHRVSLTGKTLGAEDFSAPATQRETGASLGVVSYRGGPFVISSVDLTPAALGVVDAYLAADTVTNVHVATAGFSPDIQRVLVAAPRIAVLRDGNEAIAFNYLNAANIQDSNGNAWSIASPGALTLAAAAGVNGGPFDGALFLGGQPAFDQLTSMHYTPPANDEVVREVRGWLSVGPTTHAYMQCDAIEAFENNVNGRFLSTLGLVNDGSAANPTRVRVPDSLFAQFDGALVADNGSVNSMGLLPGSTLYANSSVLIDRDGATLGSRMLWLTGHIDGDVTKGKISYLGGHNYSTAVPISLNPQTNGVRLFLNGLYETPGLFASDQPAITLTKSAPAATSAANVTFTLNYANAGPGAVFDASLSDVLPAGTTFVSATGGGMNTAGTVTWTLGTLAPGASGSVTVTVSAPEATYLNQATLAYRLGMTDKTLQSNQTTTLVDRTAPETTLTATPPSPSNSASPSFSFSSNEAGTFECSLDGAAFAACASPTGLSGLLDGSHTFQVRASDLAANLDATPASYTWTVDTVAPDTTLTSTPADPSASAAADFTFTATEAGTFECSLDGAAFAACTSPSALTGLADGAHTFEVRARDVAGNADATPASFSWNVDTTPPDTTLTATPPVLSSSSSAAFTFTSTEAGTFECSLDGAAFAACSTPVALNGLADTSHTFQVRARDAAGNADTSPASFTWLVDTTAPQTTLTATPPSPSSSASASFSFTSTEAGAFECSLDGAAFAACTTPLAVNGLTDASHTFQVRARDLAGNADASPATFTWTVDTTAPTTSFASTPQALSSSASANFTFISDEPGTFECSLDGAVFASCSSPLALTGLTDASHTLQVRARDAAGNVDASPASFTWTVDTTAPDTTLTATPPAASSSASGAFTFTASEAGTFECSLDGAAFTVCTTPAAVNGLSDASHTFQVRARDAAGNADATPASFTWTVDTAAPDTTLTFTPAALSNSAGASFSFSASEPATFECSLDGAAFAACTTPEALTGLSDASHTFLVRAIDTVGNVDASPASFTWTVDTTAPQTTLTTTPPALSASTSASFTFTASEASTFECSLDGAAFASCTTPVDLAGLADGSHTFEVRARDTATNVDATPATFTWTVDASAPDTTLTSTPPAQSNSASASFTFTSAEPGTFECSLDGAAFAACASPLALTGLLEGSHTVLVRAVDSAGNVDPTPASSTWVVDLTAPSTTLTTTPPLLSASASATFEFTSDELGATFQCSLDGAAFTTCSSPLTFPSLSEGSHTLRVQAVDAAGNLDASPASHTWSVDTLAPDTTLVSGPSGSVSSTTATLVVSSEAGATFECALDGAAFTPCNATSTYPGLADGSHTVLIRAIDATGNADATPASRTWTVDTAAPDTTIATGPSGIVASADAAFTFTSGEAPVTFECSLDGATFASCTAATSLTGLTEGSHTLEVRAVDAAGNVDLSPASQTWTVDTEAPSTSLSGAPSGTTNVSTATLSFTSNEAGVTFECSLDGAAYTACTAPLSLTALTDGPHTFSVRAIDAAGNVDSTPATATWTIDAAVPDTTITAGPTGAVASADASFTFTSTKPNSTFECSLDGASFALCPSPTDFTGLAEGSHTFSVQAIDAVGNVDPTPATRTWTVDTQAPDTTLTAQPVALTNDTTGTIEFTGSDQGLTFECSLDGAAWSPCASPFTTSGTLSDGVHVILVRAVDAAGNVDPSPSAASWEVDTIAPQPPAITEPVADATTGTLPRFGGVAEAGATVTVTINGMAVCTAVAGLDGRWSCTGATPLASGVQTATATATDGAGNTSAPSLPRAFTVDGSQPDTVILTGPPALTNEARADFTVASDISGATFECSLDGAEFAACTAAPSFVTTTDGVHRLEVRAVAGAVTDASPASWTWTRDLTPPATPVLTSPVASGTTTATPTFTGTAEAGATVVVYVDGQPACTAIADSAGEFSCAAPSALTDGAHVAHAVATDPAGNASPQSPDVSFTVVDTTLDTAIIAGPSGTVSSTTAGFAFTSTVIGATFECSLDGAAFSACPTPVTFSSLAPGSHTLEVRAVDGVNVDSTPASRTWLIDSGSPSAPTVVSPADQVILRTRLPRYSGTAEPGSTVFVSVDDREICTAIADAAGAWDCTGSFALADGAHRVAAVAIDPAGNPSPQSNANRFTVDIPAMIAVITTPVNGALTNDSTPAISGTATPGATVSVFADGMLVGTVVADASGAWSLTPTTPIVDGAHVLSATAELDGLRSPTSDTVNVTIDTRAPVVTITLTQENSESVPEVSFSADESPVTLACSVDGAAFAPCSSPLDVTAARDGNHTVVVRATDAAGNTGEATASYEVVAPIISRPATGVRGGGCGCGTTEGMSGVLAGLALLLFAARRSRRGVRLASTGAAIAAVLLTSQAASAQVAGFDLERLDLNPGGTASLVSGTGDVMRKGAWRASLFVHYQHDPLVLYRLDTDERLGSIVGSRVTTHLVGAWTPLDWLEIGLQLPIVLWQGGDDLTEWDVSPPATTSLGTPWITGRFAFLREAGGSPLDLALQLGLGLPFGSAAAFSNATPIAFAPRIGAGKSVLSWLRLGAEVGFMVRGAPDSLAQTGTASAFTFALSATTRGSGLRGELTWRGSVALDAPTAGSELLLGARYPLGKWVEIFALGGPGLGAIPGNPAFRLLAGVAVQPPAEAPKKVEQACDESVSVEVLRLACATRDADGDGVNNAADHCPRVAGVARAQGCPLPDTDGDGVVDETDACPKEKGTAERKGCPVRDRDADSVEDEADSCPDEAGLVERKGCPVKDADLDGVEDGADACPSEAGPADRNGCPIRDQDADSVEDAVDNCPTVAGTKENAGCPAKQRQLVIITKDKLEIKESVYFATGKAKVLARSRKLLDNVAEVLLAHPEVALVRVEGHTDSAGVREKNVKLSQARADSVKAELVKRKVPASRLNAVGFGPDKPVAPNDTPAGREQNRRVEFNFEEAPKN